MEISVKIEVNQVHLHWKITRLIKKMTNLRYLSRNLLVSVCVVKVSKSMVKTQIAMIWMKIKSDKNMTT